MIESQQLSAVDLQKLIPAVESSVLPDRSVGQHGTNVVVRVLLFPVHLFNRTLQADAQTSVLKFFMVLSNY